MPTPPLPPETADEILAAARKARARGGYQVKHLAEYMGLSRNTLDSRLGTLGIREEVREILRDKSVHTSPQSARVFVQDATDEGVARGVQQDNSLPENERSVRDSANKRPDTVSGQRLTRTSNANGDTLESKGTRIRTLEQLLEAAEVDLSVWRVKDYVINSWEGFSVQDGITTMFQVKARLERKHDAVEMLALRDAVVEAMREHSPAPVRRYKVVPKTGLLMEINIVDLHLGKLCAVEESGDNYDGKYAIAAFRYVMAGFLEKAASDGVERIVFQVGQDLLHVDNAADTTTAGTPQDTDGRWYKSVRRAIDLMVEAVDAMAQIAPVDIVVVAGNHARMQEQMLGEVLRAWYRNELRVTLHDGPQPRKYIRHGCNLLGYTHGDGVKAQDLPLLMATEAKELWGDTTFRTWSTGHLHQRRSTKFGSVIEDKGVEVRILPSLSAADAYHVNHGYVGNLRASEASVYCEKRGRIASYLSVLPNDYYEHQNESHDVVQSA